MVPEERRDEAQRLVDPYMPVRWDDQQRIRALLVEAYADTEYANDRWFIQLKLSLLDMLFNLWHAETLRVHIHYLLPGDRLAPVRQAILESIQDVGQVPRCQ